MGYMYSFLDRRPDEEGAEYEYRIAKMLPFVAGRLFFDMRNYDAVTGEFHVYVEWEDELNGRLACPLPSGGYFVKATLRQAYDFHEVGCGLPVYMKPIWHQGGIHPHRTYVMYSGRPFSLEFDGNILIPFEDRYEELGCKAAPEAKTEEDICESGGSQRYVLIGSQGGSQRYELAGSQGGSQRYALVGSQGGSQRYELAGSQGGSQRNVLAGSQREFWSLLGRYMSGSQRSYMVGSQRELWSLLGRYMSGSQRSYMAGSQRELWSLLGRYMSGSQRSYMVGSQRELWSLFGRYAGGSQRGYMVGSQRELWSLLERYISGSQRSYMVGSQRELWSLLGRYMSGSQRSYMVGSQRELWSLLEKYISGSQRSCMAGSRCGGEDRYTDDGFCQSAGVHYQFEFPQEWQLINRGRRPEHRIGGNAKLGYGLDLL